MHNLHFRKFLYLPKFQHPRNFPTMFSGLSNPSSGTNANTSANNLLQQQQQGTTAPLFGSATPGTSTFGGFGSFGAAPSSGSGSFSFGSTGTTQPAPFSFGSTGSQQQSSQFGQQQPTSFGQQSATGFGSVASKPAGSSLFGAQPGTFGSGTQPGTFGSQQSSFAPQSSTTQTTSFGSSLFGSSFKPTTTPLGTQQSSTPFGTQQPSTPFGTQQSSTPFSTQQSSTPFGTQQSSTPFGSQVSAFGSQQSSTPFGSQAPSFSSPFGSQSSSFSSQPTSSTGLFGTTPALSAVGSITSGTGNPPFSQTSDLETDKTVYLQSISAMPSYRSKSPEELRWEDYQRGNKFAGFPSATQQIGTSSFSTQQPSAQFGGISFGTSGTQGFASTQTPFGSTQSTPQAFGNVQSSGQQGFGNVQPTGQGFGSTQSNTSFNTSTPLMFGSAGASSFQPQSTGTFGSQSSNLFGTSSAAPASTGMFGSTAPNSSSTTTGLFGSSGTSTGGLFGSANTTTSTGGMFGASSGTPFGASSTTSSATPFGTSGTPFGSTNAPFGSSSNTSFSTPSTATPFGSSSRPTSLFSQPQQTSAPQQTTNLFGTSANNAPSTSLFSTNTNTPFSSSLTSSSNLASSTFKPSFSTSTPYSTPQSTSSYYTPSSIVSTSYNQPSIDVNPYGPSSIFPTISTATVSNSPNYQESSSILQQSSPSSQSVRRTPLRLPKSFVKFKPTSTQEKSENLQATSILGDLLRGGDSIKKLVIEFDTEGKKNPTEFMFSGQSSRGESFKRPSDLVKTTNESLLISSDNQIKSSEFPSKSGITQHGIKNSHSTTSLSKDYGNEQIALDSEQLVPQGHYFSVPPVSQLKKMDKDSLKSLADFKIGRKGIGLVEFLVPVDLSTVPLDRIYGGIVQFSAKQISVYPDSLVDVETAEPGTGLNVPARVTLYGCWPVDPETKAPICQSIPEDALKKHLRKLALVEDCDFVDFDPRSGGWTFRVNHFSSYSYEESDSVENNQCDNVLLEQSLIQKVI